MIKKRQCNQSGFTLPELLISAVIMVLVFVGILLTYIKCMELNEMARNSSLAVAAVKSRMEGIKNTPFEDLIDDFHEVTFPAPAGLTGMGVSYVEDTAPDVYTITVAMSWRQKNGRVIGEDLDLDGVIDTVPVDEDVIDNNKLDSKVQAVTVIFNE